MSAPKMLCRKSSFLLQLQPNEPPGHRSRKARSFELEIARLRRQGYSLDVIRAALADAGMAVSRSTVHREATRLRVGHSEQSLRSSSPVSQRPATCLVLASQPDPQLTRQQFHSPAATPSATPALHPAISVPPITPDVQAAPATCLSRGRDVADRFMAGRITNPLLLARMNK
jgi:hypothetical protein